MNKIFLIGNLTRDTDTKTTPNGVQVCSFTIAVKSKGKTAGGEEVVQYFNCSAWRGLADICGRYLSKGKKVYVSGELFVRTYTAKDGTTKVSLDVQVAEVEFLSPKSESTDEPSNTDANGFTEVSSDDIPFL